MRPFVYRSGGVSVLDLQPMCPRCGEDMIASIDGICTACWRAQGHPSFGGGRPERSLPPPPRTTSRTATAYERQKAARDAAEARLYEALRPMKAALDGAALGKLHAGDPWRAAKALGISVRVVDLSGAGAMGRYWLPSSVFVPGPAIDLHDGLSLWKRDETLAYELARHAGYQGEPDPPGDDPSALAFARAFLDQEPSRVRQRVAQKYQREMQERLQREARMRALTGGGKR